MNGDPLDPDAIWKPGYSGGYATPAGVGAVSPQAGRSSWRLPRALVGAMAVLALLAIGATLWNVGGSRPSPARPWTVSLEAETVSAVASAPEHVFVLLAGPGALVALDHATGEQRWRRSAPGAAATGLDVVDGVVITRHLEADAAGRAVAFDAQTGRPLWSLALSSGERLDVVDGVISRDRVRSSQGEAAGRAVLDVRTGEPTGAPGVVDRSGPNENLITRFGTATGLARARVDTLRGALEIVVEPGAGTITLTFVPAAG